MIRNQGIISIKWYIFHGDLVILKYLLRFLKTRVYIVILILCRVVVYIWCKFELYVLNSMSAIAESHPPRDQDALYIYTHYLYFCIIRNCLLDICNNCLKFCLWKNSTNRFVWNVLIFWYCLNSFETTKCAKIWIKNPEKNLILQMC